MRILRVENNNIYNLAFGRKGKTKKKHDYEARAKQLEEDKKPEELADFNYGAYLAKLSKRAEINPMNAPLKVEKPLPFEETHAKFTLDKYQKEAIEAYNSGKTTVVSAPTGTGKTLIAEHIIKKALDENKKIIYLSPLKALSNEKYSDFAKLFGEYDKDGNLVNTKNLGLLTGDSTINPNAPIMVMTTEIYRNSLLTTNKEGASKKYQDYDGVIYDEFHYLGDDDRGTVWEEAVMNTPEHMKQLMLSATASNAPSIIDWIETTNNKIPTHLVSVPESERHVPLREMAVLRTHNGDLVLESTQSHNIDIHQIEHNELLSDRQKATLNEMKAALNLQTDENVINYIKEASGKNKILKSSTLSDKMVKGGMEKDKADSISLILSKKGFTKYKENFKYNFAQNPDLNKVINKLNENEMTPALLYIFSKKRCESALYKAAESGDSLLTEEESQRVYEEVQNAKNKGVFLGADFDDTALTALTKGYAVHHAGKLPAYKSLIEKLAREGLVKACFATETLIAGINMPFRTTVFTAFEKEDNDGVVHDISTQTFKQGAGRAGRRGKDTIGNVVILPKSYTDYDKYVQLSASTDTSISSKYQLSYATLLSDRMLNKKDENILKTLAVHQNSDNIDLLEDEADSRLKLLSDLGYVKEKEDGTLERTEKGNFAQKVFGANEIFLTELLHNPNYLKDFTSIELTALCAAYSDVKDEDPSDIMGGDYMYMNNRMSQIFDLSDRINEYEEKYGISAEPIKFSTNIVPYVLRFAQGPKDRASSVENWQNIMKSLKANRLMSHEGDFLRLVNGTVDILKQIMELTEDENIRQEAKKAIANLKKAPVTDIFNYELQDNAQKSDSEYEF